MRCHLWLLAALLAWPAAGDDDGGDRARWPLIFAAGEGDSATVVGLLAGGHPVGERSRDGESALHVAGIRGDVATVAALIAAGADVDARTPAGSTMSMTPLHWAIYHGHEAMVSLLLDAGADPTAANEHGKTPLEMCDDAAQAGASQLIRDAIAEAHNTDSLVEDSNRIRGSSSDEKEAGTRKGSAIPGMGDVGAKDEV